MHFASYYRWLVYQHLFDRPVPQSTLLDIGSDDGGFVARMPDQTSVVIDPSIAALHQSPAPLRICADGRFIPLRYVAFDYVILSDVVEHVVDDATLVASVTSRVRPGGTFWLSTTASQFSLFPAFITRRAEQKWGHVRKGYTPEQLVRLIGTDFDCCVVEWPEIALRHCYLVLWLCSKLMPALARRLAAVCFWIDRMLPRVSQRHGHLYVRATRHLCK